MKPFQLGCLALSFVILVACNSTQTTPDPSQEDQIINQETESDIDTNVESMVTQIVTKEVIYHSDKPNARGYLAVPEGGMNLPGVILVHEWWGLTDDIRQKTEEFAAEGYIALAVDLYDGRSTTNPEEARAFATEVREDMEGAFANLEAGLEYLKEQSADENRLASVGWCFGGGWSLEMAKNNLGTQASIIYYGRFNPEDDLEQMRAKILGHFGEEDASIQVSDVEQFQATLQNLSDEHEIYIYPNAGHSFANEGDALNEEAAKLAWQRSLEFLDNQLR